jgi:hypothetical protein
MMLRTAAATSLLKPRSPRKGIVCKVTDVVSAQGVPLLSDLDGHAGIEPFVREGYEIVVF